jgi:hypothetical protein
MKYQGMFPDVFTVVEADSEAEAALKIMEVVKAALTPENIIVWEAVQ